MQVVEFISVLILAAAPGQALTQPEGYEAWFERASKLRLEIERLDDSRKEISTQRDRLASRLEELARQIKERKAKNATEGLIPDFTLQKMLRESQNISESLRLLRRELEDLNHVRFDRLQKLGQVYGRLVDQMATKVRQATGQKRAKLLGVLARLLGERDSIRKALAPGSKPALRMDTRGMLASSDPEELHERADSLRDEQDRRRRYLTSLDHRIAELKTDYRLEREMRDFQEDQMLFSEQSRILQFYTTDALSGDSPDSKEGGDYFTPPLVERRGEEYHNPIGETEIYEGKSPAGVDVDNTGLEQLSIAEQLRMLQRERQRIVQQVKELQILHDLLLERAESLEAE